MEGKPAAQPGMILGSSQPTGGDHRTAPGRVRAPSRNMHEGVRAQVMPSVPGMTHDAPADSPRPRLAIAPRLRRPAGLCPAAAALPSRTGLGQVGGTWDLQAHMAAVPSWRAGRCGGASAGTAYSGLRIGQGCPSPWGITSFGAWTAAGLVHGRSLESTTVSASFGPQGASLADRNQGRRNRCRFATPRPRLCRCRTGRPGPRLAKTAVGRGRHCGSRQGQVAASEAPGPRR